MRVCLLGPLAIDDEGRAIRLSGARQKAVVACLALQANLAVPTELLVTDIWGEESPAESTNALQAAVSRLRRLLPAGRLVTAGGGYLLRLLPGEFDVGTFEQAVRDGEAALERGAVQDARVLLRHALGLWRGQALADFRYEPFAQTHIARLEELHLTCLEARIEADLAAGAGSHVLAELQHLVSDHPLRERVRGQLMRALYQAGRQAEALATYRQLRSL